MPDIKKLKNLYRDCCRKVASGGAYPGEWIEQNLLSQDQEPDIGTVKKTALLAAENVSEWDEDSNAYNAEQRLGILDLFEKYADRSAAVSAALKVLCEHDRETAKPLLSAEKDEEKAEKYKALAKTATDPVEMAEIMAIDDSFIDCYKKAVEEFAEKADPFDDEEALLIIAEANAKAKTKNRFLTALSRLKEENVTSKSSAFKTLNRYYSERQIRFLNMKWGGMYYCYGKIRDNIILEFYNCIIFGNDKSPLRDCEKTLLKDTVKVELSRKVQEENELYYVLCNSYTEKGYPDTLPNDETWIFMAELFSDYLNVNSYRAESRSIRHTSFLDFFPLKEGAEERLKAVHPSIACTIINEYFGASRRNGRFLIADPEIVLPPDGEPIDFSKGFSGKDFEDAKRLKEICLAVFGGDYMDVLDKHACYGVMTFLVRTGTEKEPEQVTNWIRSLGGQFGAVCAIHLYEKTGELPKWALSSLDYSSTYGQGINGYRVQFMEALKRSAVEGLTKEQKRQFIDIILEAAFLYYPSDYIDVILELFRSDTSYNGSVQDPFLLSDYFTQDEIKEMGESLKEAVEETDYDHCVRPHLITREEYKELKEKEEEEERRKAEEEELAREKAKTEAVLQTCEELHYSTRCLWRLEDLKDGPVKHDIQEKIAKRLITDFEKTGNIRDFFQELSKIYRFPADVLLEVSVAMTGILENLADDNHEKEAIA